MAKSSITQETLKSLLHYDPAIGVFVWKRRDISLFRNSHFCNAWNARFAGKTAGNINKKLGYRVIGLFDSDNYAHRLAWLYVYGEWPDFVDHINHDGSDNRIKNLRSVMKLENHKNMNRSKKNTSGFVGVTWNDSIKKWVAQIKVNYRTIVLGYYENIEDAVKRRKEAEIEYGFHPNHGMHQTNWREHRHLMA